MSRVLLALIVSAALFAAAPSALGAPPIKHVFTIVLENKGYDETFGPSSPAKYLSRTLPSQGALLTQYYGTAHHSLANYIAMASGQSPTPDTQADCPLYRDFLPGTPTSDGQYVGQGCVYPAQVKTIADQLDARGLGWKGYMEDMGNAPGESATCAHPAFNTPDQTQSARPGDGYAAKHDPFVYFHSLLDSGSCDRNVVALSKLTTDLQSAATTPSYAFITPNLCNDGHDYPCTNQPSGASALADIDAFLETWVPKITAAQAYKENGLIEIVFDEAANSETEACCEEQPGPGSPLPGITGPGGGRVGAVLLSPFIKAGTVSATSYNHYSSLATWETLFGVGRLAYAATVPSLFGADVFTAAPHR